MTEFQAPKGVPDYLPPESAQFVAVREGQDLYGRGATEAEAAVHLEEQLAEYAPAVLPDGRFRKVSTRLTAGIQTNSERKRGKRDGLAKR